MRGDSAPDDELPANGSVEDFFRRERERIPELPGHELHWRGIVQQARRSRRPRRTGRVLAGVAAAAVLLVGGGLVWQDLGSGDEGQGAASQAEQSGGMSAQSSPQVAVGGPLRVLAFSARDDDTREVLTSASCDGQAGCPVLWRTDDDGETWQQRALPQLRATPEDGIATGPGQVGLVRLGSDGRGWLAGSMMLRTEDGGRTWSDFAHPGGTVLAMTADRDAVTAVSGDSCDGGECDGRLRVHRAGAGASRMGQVVLDEDLGSYRDVDLTDAKGSTYLSLDTDDGPRVWRLTGQRARELDVCPGADSLDLAVPADGSETMTALCESTDGDSTRLAPSTSEDGGETWSRPGAARTVRGSAVDVTAPNGDALVVVTDAKRGSGIHRSTDGGEAWTEVEGPHGPWRWTAAGGAGRVYVISADGRLLESRDGGATWERVRLN